MFWKCFAGLGGLVADGMRVRRVGWDWWLRAAWTVVLPLLLLHLRSFFLSFFLSPSLLEGWIASLLSREGLP